MRGRLRIAVSLLMLVPSAPMLEGQEAIPPASMRFAEGQTAEVPDFQRHVVPLLGRLGCNSAKCHGSFQGRGGLRLSLFGFDFQGDHSALVAKASSEPGSRLDRERPEESLVILKPTEQIDHEGGKRFDVGTWQHHLMSRWISSGAGGPIQDESDDVDAESVQGQRLFHQRIDPLLKSHCYECHAYGSPKANLKLTSREAVLRGGSSGAAIVPRRPDASLLMKAVTVDDDQQMPPSGRLKQSEIDDLRSWIEMGAPWPEANSPAPAQTDQLLVDLQHEPAEIQFKAIGDRAQIRLIAEWENGDREDVTCLSRFQTNDDTVATVDADGVVTCVGRGDTHIIAFYDNGVAAVPVMRRYVEETTQARFAGFDGQASKKLTPSIDYFVGAKLHKLGLLPSAPCTDAEFLRRVSIDMTGTLPTPGEVTSFLADRSERKRERKVDELLQRSTYAAWWANKLCDFTGCNPTSIDGLLGVATERGYVRASEWYDWIYDRVRENQSYDGLVEGIMLPGAAPEQDQMPHFWTRQSLTEPKDMAMSVAHAFLGIQLQCAECHKHPFDRWTQSDFNQFSDFFRSLNRGQPSPRDGETDLQLLRSKTVRLRAGDDPRGPIMEWMRDRKNPWFAKAFVNRVWAGYFHVGIVDPPDQFTPANPPSNPPLLDWLTEGFIENGYDMKWLHRQIATSQTYQRSWRPNETNREDRRNYSRSLPRRIPAEVVYDAMKQATAASAQQDLVRTNLRRRASGHLSMRMAGTHAMKVFGKPDRSLNCDCERVNEPTLLQAIFTQNDPLVRMRVNESGWVIEVEEGEAAGSALDQNELIDEAWLRTLGRLPSEEERGRASEHLDSGASAAEGLADLLWALINTKEFLLNH